MNIVTDTKWLKKKKKTKYATLEIKQQKKS